IASWDIEYEWMDLVELQSTSIALLSTIDFTPDGTYFCASAIKIPAKIPMLGEFTTKSGENETSICIWDTKTEKVTVEIPHEYDPCHTIRLSPNCTRIAAVANATIHIWDVQDGKHSLELVHVDNGHEVTEVAFSYRFCIPRAWWSLRMERRERRSHIRPLEVLVGSSEVAMRFVTFSPTGDRILYRLGNDILVRDAWNGQVLLGSLQGYNDLGSINFSPDGTRVVSGWSDGVIRVYDVRTPDTMTESPDDTSTVISWKMREDGWVVDNQSRLPIWVPHYLQKSLMGPRTTLLLSREGYLYLNFDGARIGKAWVECYVPDSED
ncbi:hypothetical protein FRC11_000486, partial [Ceratobasidium sp. 423]